MACTNPHIAINRIRRARRLATVALDQVASVPTMGRTADQVVEALASMPPHGWATMGALADITDPSETTITAALAIVVERLTPRHETQPCGHPAGVPCSH